ncbi:Crossover junction endonuclease mus81 [Hypocenomyce scalaris]|nr:Crossover junction endonuclease mus81 [Hypocenomyce scalaris]
MQESSNALSRKPDRQILGETTSTKQRVKGTSTAKTDTSTAFRKPPNSVLLTDDFVELLSSPVQPVKRKPAASVSKGGSSKPLAEPPLEAPIDPPRMSVQDSGPQPFPPTFEPIRISPDNFTVQLVLDNREVRAINDRDYIASELTKKGVTPIVRPLELGDALWIAKCHDPTLLSRYGEEGDEIVLDWIVERKRLDDLVGSIKDGRFHEQKFRLRKSGVKNVIYVIEEIAMNIETAQKYHEAVESAIASTQVVNGYFVKRTGKLDETIRYLARMTVMLKDLYEVGLFFKLRVSLNRLLILHPSQSSSLHLIPTRHLHPTTYLPLLTHLRSGLHNDTTNAPKNYHITYPSFSSLASKSDSLTLRDVFLKMLMCSRGVTGDKALEIQKVWETPGVFVEAFENCGKEGDAKEAREKERKKMVMERLGGLVGRRKVGKVLSAKVAEVWGEG